MYAARIGQPIDVQCPETSGRLDDVAGTGDAAVGAVLGEAATTDPAPTRNDGTQLTPMLRGCRDGPRDPQHARGRVPGRTRDVQAGYQHDWSLGRHGEAAVAMVSLTVFIQLIAALTIPATVGCIAMTQLNTGAKFQWKQGRIALVLSIVPLLLVLTLQGILGSVSTLLAIGGLLVVVLLGNPD